MYDTDGSGNTCRNATQDATAEFSEVLRGVSAASTTPRPPPPPPPARLQQPRPRHRTPFSGRQAPQQGHSRTLPGPGWGDLGLLPIGASCPSLRRALGPQPHQVPPHFLAVWGWGPRAQKHDFIKCSDGESYSCLFWILSLPTKEKGSFSKASLKTSRNGLKQLSTLCSDSGLAAVKCQTRA